MCISRLLETLVSSCLIITMVKVPFLVPYFIRYFYLTFSQTSTVFRECISAYTHTKQRQTYTHISLCISSMISNIHDIKNNAWVTVNNDFFGHEWGDLPMIFTSDEVASKNHWQITSRVTKKSLFTVTNVLFYFLHAILYLEHTVPLQTIIDRSFLHCR